MEHVAVLEGGRARRATVFWPLVAVLLGVLAGAVVLAATGPHGPGLSPDSAAYLSTADALAHGRGFQTYGRLPLTDFPPGYPLALSAWLEVFGGSVADAARAVNVLALAGLVAGTAAALAAYVRRAALRAAGLVLLVLAPALLHAGVFAWSEPLFSAC